MITIKIDKKDRFVKGAEPITAGVAQFFFN